jgi:hypothetical protein
MKKVWFSLGTALVLALSGCGGGDGGTADTITAPAAEVLETVLADAPEQPASVLSAALTADQAEQMLGLTADEFGQYVAEASAAQPMIGSFAFEVAVVKANDPAAAATVKDLVAQGFDSGKWICVFPEQSAVVVSGSYVLLAAAPAATVDAAVAAFSELAGGHVGAVDTFYTAG